MEPASDFDFRTYLREPARGLVGGMICAVFSAVVLLYAADYVFLRIPEVNRASLPVRIPKKWPHELIYSYGGLMWLGLAGLSAASLVLAFKNHNRRAYVAFNLYVLMGTAGFAFVVRQGALRPLMSLFEGIGTHSLP
jgi:hypothetical protein